MSAARWLIGISVALVVLVVSADRLLRQISLETYRSEIDAGLSEYLDADVEVTGSIHLELLPRLHLEVEGITVGNLRGRTSSHRVEIGRLRLDVDELVLLSGVVSIEAIELSDADLYLGSGGAGQELVDLDREREATSKSGVGSAFRFEPRRARIANLRIGYDAARKRGPLLELEHLTIETDDSTSRIRLEAIGEFLATRYELNAETGSWDELLDSSLAFPVQARLETKGIDSGQSFGLDIIGGFDPVSPSHQPNTGGTEKPPDGGLLWRGHVEIGESRLDGHWEAFFSPGGRQRIEVVAHSAHVSLIDLGMLAPEGTLGRPDAPSWFDRWWLDAAALPVEILGAMDIDMALSAERISGREGFELAEVHGVIHLEKGDLEFRDVRARYEGGRAEASLRVDTHTDSPSWTFSIEAGDIDLTRIFQLLPANKREIIDGPAGRLGLSAQLSSRGVTRAAMTSALEGRVRATLRDGSLLSRYGRAVSRDFLHVTVPQFLNSNGEASARRVRCLLVVAPVRNGIASIEQFYLDTDRISVVGAGWINLPRNELDLRLIPRIHDPGLVSIAATVDVKGPLEAPVFSPVIKSLATSAARALFENAMRPVRGSLLGGLGDLAGLGGLGAATGRKDPCAATNR